MTKKTRKEKIWEAQERAKPAATAVTMNFLVILASILLFPVAAILRPFGDLRIGLLYHRAIGRFCGNTEYFLRVRQLHRPGRRTWVILISGTPVSRQILTMIGRRCQIIKSDFLWKTLDLLRNKNPDHSLWIDLGCTGWLRGNEWSEPGPQLSFIDSEHQRGQAILREIGIPDGADYVCIFAKDRKYTDSPDTVLDPKSYWGTRDFRNCDIKNYLPAAEYLANQGLYVVRVGLHEPEECLPKNIHPNIIDYTGRIRPMLADPDFADIYLQAHCKFFLGTTSGIYILSSMFGVPVAYANMIPYGECGRMDHDIFIVKKCRDRHKNTFIPFPELIAKGMDSDWFTENEINAFEADGIEFVENNPDQILELTREMFLRLSSSWADTPEDEKLQHIYRQMSPAKNLDGSEFPSRVGSEFLRQNMELLK